MVPVWKMLLNELAHRRETGHEQFIDMFWDSWVKPGCGGHDGALV